MMVSVFILTERRTKRLAKTCTYNNRVMVEVCQCLCAQVLFYFSSFNPFRTVFYEVEEEASIIVSNHSKTQKFRFKWCQLIITFDGG